MYCLEPIRTNISKQSPENCYYHQHFWTLRRFLIFFQFHLLVICFIDKPYLLVWEVFPPLVEWDFKTETSILYSANIFFNQFSIGQDLTALCGCLKLTNNCFFSVLIIFVVFKYFTVREIISSFCFFSYFVNVSLLLLSRSLNIVSL